MSAPDQKSTSEIANNMLSQFTAILGQTASVVFKSALRVIAFSVAGVFALLWKYIGWIFQQMFVITATFGEVIINGIPINPLVAWGELIGLGSPTPATQAEATVDITVTTQTGSLPSGVQLTKADTGVVYATINSILLDAPTKTVSVRAVGDQSGGDGSGAIGDLTALDVLQFVSPFTNVDREAVVNTPTVNGEDAESEDVYRQRVIDRFRLRPQGGAGVDYVIWGTEVAGIVDILPYVNTTDPGAVDVFVESTNPPDGIPTAGELQAVKDSIELDENGLATRRPLTAFVNVLAITREEFDVSVIGIAGVSDLPQVQADITTAITTYFFERRPFIDGVTLPPRTDKIFQTAIIGIVEDIVTAANGSFTDATFELSSGGGPITSFTLGTGQKAKLLNIGFV